MPTNAAENEVRRSYQSIVINAPTQSCVTRAPGQLTSGCKTLASKVLFASTKKQLVQHAVSRATAHKCAASISAPRYA